MSQENLDREKPVGELLKQLSQETTLLVRQELDLAKAELTQKGKAAGVGAGLLGGAGVTALVGLTALMLTLLFALDTAMPTWAAALITTVVFFAIAAAQALIGRKRLQDAAPPTPAMTTESVKEDLEWAKTRATSART